MSTTRGSGSSSSASPPSKPSKPAGGGWGGRTASSRSGVIMKRVDPMQAESSSWGSLTRIQLSSCHSTRRSRRGRRSWRPHAARQGVPHPLDRRVEHGRAEAQARGVGLDHSGRADREKACSSSATTATPAPSSSSRVAASGRSMRAGPAARRRPRRRRQGRGVNTARLGIRIGTSSASHNRRATGRPAPSRRG